MLDILKPMLESGLVNDETRTAINEAWQNKLKEIQTQMRTEIREEFAGRYEHDKEVMVATLDKMVSETLSIEIQKIKSERNEVAKLKLGALKEMKAAAKKFNTFASRALAEELAEFAHERKLSQSHKAKLEKFVMASLAEEINEFAQDKRDVTNTKVRLVAEAKNQLNRLKKKFVERSSKAVSNIVAETLNSEIKQLHNDIKIARQNNFGRKIYEAFATEFTGTYLNENAEVRKLKNKISKIGNQLAESKKQLVAKTKLVESNQKNVQLLKNRVQRENVLSELLNPLDKTKKEVMQQLLENVQTSHLRAAYDKYLPAVLSNKAQSFEKKTKNVLHESAGNKTAKFVPIDEDSLTDIKRLAGLNN